MVTDLLWANDAKENKDKLQGIFSAIEQRSEHPLADAIVAYLKSVEVKPAIVSSFNSLTGRGVEAMFHGETYLAGSHKLIEEKGIVIPADLKTPIASYLNQATTVIYSVAQFQCLCVFNENAFFGTLSYTHDNCSWSSKP